MNAPSSLAPSEPLTVQITGGVTVLAKLYKGRAVAYTFANRTQAENAAWKAGKGWEVVQLGTAQDPSRRDAPADSPPPSS